MAFFGSLMAKKVLQCSRSLSVSCFRENMDREARMLSKLLSNKVERKIQATPNANRVVKLLDKRRTAVLNKMYMANITEVLAFGGFDEIADRGLQVTQVSVRDTSTVEVFWLASEDQDPIQMQNILTSIAGKVGSQLMYANMVGHVPQIVFKRDLSAIHVETTQRLLDKLAAQTSLEKDLATVTVNGVPEPLAEHEVDSPTMRMDTLGLAYDKILKRIKESKKKNYPLQIPVPPSSEEFESLAAASHSTSSNNVEKQHEKKKELRKFISLYQKSELSSSARKRNLVRREAPNFYIEEGDGNVEEECFVSDFEDWNRDGRP